MGPKLIPKEWPVAKLFPAWETMFPGLQKCIDEKGQRRPKDFWVYPRTDFDPNRGEATNLKSTMTSALEKGVKTVRKIGEEIVRDYQEELKDTIKSLSSEAIPLYEDFNLAKWTDDKI